MSPTAIRSLMGVTSFNSRAKVNLWNRSWHRRSRGVPTVSQRACIAAWPASDTRSGDQGSLSGSSRKRGMRKGNLRPLVASQRGRRSA